MLVDSDSKKTFLGSRIKTPTRVSICLNQGNIFSGCLTFYLWTGEYYLMKWLVNFIFVFLYYFVFWWSTLWTVIQPSQEFPGISCSFVAVFETNFPFIAPSPFLISLHLFPYIVFLIVLSFLILLSFPIFNEFWLLLDTLPLFTVLNVFLFDLDDIEK